MSPISVDCGSEGGFPPGRLVSGMTETPLGLIRFIAVCIPWKSAHVTTGQKNRAPWQDHIHFLDALTGWLKPSNVPTVLLGDFNQRIPRVAQPVEVYERLSSVLLLPLRVVTAGSVAGAELPLIDHIAVSGDLEPVEVRAFSALGEGGVKLSDHPGIRARFSVSNGA